MCYYILVAYDGNEKHKACGSGGTADALASGASGGDPVEVQILSTAPFNFWSKSMALGLFCFACESSASMRKCKHSMSF